MVSQRQAKKIYGADTDLHRQTDGQIPIYPPELRSRGYNKAISLYDLHDHTLDKNPCPGGHKIYNFGRHFLGHYYYTLSLSESCLGVENLGTCNSGDL